MRVRGARFSLTESKLDFPLRTIPIKYIDGFEHGISPFNLKEAFVFFSLKFAEITVL